MCGLFLFYNRTGLSFDDKHRCISAINHQEHRGPDNISYQTYNCHTFAGHARLSIVDLSNKSNQPFFIKETLNYIVFNGEIYNHKHIRAALSSHGIKFDTNSDTEVLLRAYQFYGDSFLEKCEGMFAFCIWDHQLQTFCFGRDRSGEKPLYLFNTSTYFIVSSELRSFRFFQDILDLRLDPESISYFLSYGRSLSNTTVIKNILKVPPAHLGFYSVSSGHLELKRYWSPVQKRSNSCIHTIESASELLDKLFRDSIRQIIDSEVNTCVLLSGGLDSSLVTAYASQYSSNINTFSVTFGANNILDESQFSLLVAQHFSTNHTSINLESIAPNDFISAITSIDDPFIDSSYIASYLLSRSISKMYKVAIGGDGADEIFGGYSHHTSYSAYDHYKKNDVTYLHSLDSVLHTAGRCLPLGLKGRAFLERASFGYINRINTLPYFFDNPTIYRLLKDKSLFSPDSSLMRCASLHSRSSLLDQSLLDDFSDYLPNNILTKVDQSSMAHSIEMRSPFLNSSIINFSFSTLNRNFKNTGKTSKVILKKLGADILPNSLNLERKQGFSIPLPSLLSNSVIRDFSDSLLFSNDSLFSRPALSYLNTSCRLGFSNHERKYGLVVLQSWFDRFFANSFR
jgi:asparagine synthase (glutamine-hydrolysing)